MKALRVFVTILALFALPACARERAGAWLAEAEAAHQDADRRIHVGDVVGARAVLLRAAEETPPKAASSEDARVVRQDFYARLATLDVERGHAKEALASATAGLALGRAADPFTVNLLITRGHAFEQLEDTARATADYHDALVVTETLLDRTLEGSGGAHD
jgi:hypothetical protein